MGVLNEVVNNEDSPSGEELSQELDVSHLSRHKDGF